MSAAYREGLYFHGDIDIPVIDWRPYREEILDMHNSHQSFASRQRMRDWDGKASNQVIWFSEDRRRSVARGAGRDRRVGGLARIRAGVRRRAATDRCFTATGTEIARGAHVWDGILDHRAPGVCTQRFPLHSTSRIVAGGPLRGGVYKCALQPVSKAIARGLYGSWKPTAAERTRLEQIFPTGVCDYTKPDQGLPKVGHRRYQPVGVGFVVVVDEAGADGAVGGEAEVALELVGVVVAVPDGDLALGERGPRPRARCGRRR